MKNKNNDYCIRLSIKSISMHTIQTIIIIIEDASPVSAFLAKNVQRFGTLRYNSSVDSSCLGKGLFTLPGGQLSKI